jgi:hypothetical protein
VNSGSVWYLRAPPLAARGFTRRVAGTEKSGDLNRFLLLLFFVFVFFFFFLAVMGVSYYLQTKENLKH